ncbi:hypothetical protein [Rouxiella sp. Mn2063]|uniref:hypothetical protein n=1 Tax=Rouxiella sp. Mn2063 TaxID=3395262 RepID=UPI003BCEA5BE
MKIKLLFLLTAVFYSVSSMAAFTNNESEQLSEINTKSKNRVSEIIGVLDKSINEQISNNPEKKKRILELKNAWGILIIKKCQLETFDSKGTDAEISGVNDCLYNGYQREISYFTW